ncbi:Non-reducing end alpha-L-arabinofuranosidase BoGH43B [Paramyrothecium foliicola]|nr:Non-reducing end alpha-L-arabinofuranosidase BoGH43B [Paramyrothecium foliicola]
MGSIYYLSTVEGVTDEGHQQWMFRSASGPFDPWETGPVGTVNPLVFHDEHPDIRNTGHMDLVEGRNGPWWAVFLGVQPQGDGAQQKGVLGRETFLASAEWKNGWPVVN